MGLLEGSEDENGGSRELQEVEHNAMNYVREK